MEEAVDADRILLMDSGKLVMDGSPREVFQNVELLKEYRMDVPLITELAHKLQKKGFPIEKTILKKEEMEEELFKLKAAGNKDISELTDFLYNTKDIQVSFIFERLENSLEKMLEVANDKENVRKQFYRVAKSPNGLYPLIDYVNFKGEGTSNTETYNGEGWGLLQVLENMKGTGSGKAALVEFSDSAKFVLERRVKNSDPARNERKWLAGWLNRCNTYKN